MLPIERQSESYVSKHCSKLLFNQKVVDNNQTNFNKSIIQNLNQNIKSSYYTRCTTTRTTPKRVTSLWGHLGVIIATAGNPASFEGMLQRWRAVDIIVSNLTSPKCEPQAFRSRGENDTGFVLFNNTRCYVFPTCNPSLFFGCNNTQQVGVLLPTRISCLEPR